MPRRPRLAAASRALSRRRGEQAPRARSISSARRAFSAATAPFSPPPPPSASAATTCRGGAARASWLDAERAARRGRRRDLPGDERGRTSVASRGPGRSRRAAPIRGGFRARRRFRFGVARPAAIRGLGGRRRRCEGGRGVGGGGGGGGDTSRSVPMTSGSSGCFASPSARGCPEDPPSSPPSPPPAPRRERRDAFRFVLLSLGDLLGDLRRDRGEPLGTGRGGGAAASLEVPRPLVRPRGVVRAPVRARVLVRALLLVRRPRSGVRVCRSRPTGDARRDGIWSGRNRRRDPEFRRRRDARGQVRLAVRRRRNCARRRHRERGDEAVACAAPSVRAAQLSRGDVNFFTLM